MQTLTFSNLLISFIAGFFTFFAGCLAPMALIYVGYLAGISPKDKRFNRFAFSKNALFFTLGFTGIFFLLGMSLQSLGRLVAVYQRQISLIMGAILVLIGLSLTQLINIPFLSRTFSFKNNQPKSTIFSSFIMGITFGFSWTPCIGPVLASILFWASRQETALSGGILLLAFSIGLGLPFFLLGLFFDSFYPFVKKIEKYAHMAQVLAGFVVILFGLMLLSGTYGYMSNLFLKNLGNWSLKLIF